jgi:hypothetical protein
LDNQHPASRTKGRAEDLRQAVQLEATTCPSADLKLESQLMPEPQFRKALALEEKTSGAIALAIHPDTARIRNVALEGGLQDFIRWRQKAASAAVMESR